MAKKSKKSGKNRNAKKAVLPRAVRAGLDAAGSAYARLLSDPCNAPLVHPVYTGGDAGYLARFEKRIEFNHIGTTTSGVLHWTPGAIGSNGVELIGATNSSPSAANTFAVQASSPGASYLGTNTDTCRCVAACMVVEYIGRETDRAGMVFVGSTNGSTLELSSGTTVNNVTPLLEKFQRTGMIEQVWTPTNGDQEWTDPQRVTTQQEKASKGAITFAWSAITAVTGISVRMVAVYEYKPISALGFIGEVQVPYSSKNTLADVVRVAKAVAARGLQYAGSQMASGALRTASQFIGGAPLGRALPLMLTM